MPPDPVGVARHQPAGGAGRVVVVAGPDGSGKSLVAAQLLEAASARGPVLHIHHRPGVLPGGTRHDGPVTEPHRQDPYPRLLGLLKLVYLAFDYRIGWSSRITRVVRAGGTVVIERGWWDLLVDPRRYRLLPSPRTVRLLARLLPSADVTFVLDAPADVLLARKTELPAAELERQRTVWRAVARRVPSVRLWDATRPVTEVVAAALDDAPTFGPHGWVAAPSSDDPRWLLPRAPARATRRGFRIHRPVSTRAIVAWLLGYLLAGTGGARLLPRAAPTERALEQFADLVPDGGTVATSRSNHPGRGIALVFDAAGRAVHLVKTSSDAAGVVQLAREAAAVRRFGGALRSSVLRAPQLRSAAPGRLVYEPVSWRLDLRPWRLDPAVARELGKLHAAERRPDGTGIGHGDFAPWNLLRAPTGWYLVDWESAGGDHPPFGDLFHFLVQSHALLGRPSAEAIVGGVRGDGWVWDCVHAYATAAGLPPRDAEDHLVRYLETSAPSLDLTGTDAQRGRTARQELRRRLAEPSP